MRVTVGDGVELECRAVGSGEPTMVFVHGATMCGRYWDRQVEHFADRYQCVVYDQRGHGDSDTSDGPMPITRFADDLAELIDALKLYRLVVVAHSMGCAVAIEMAARHPDVARGLVLNDPPSMEAPDLARYQPLIDSLESGADVVQTLGAMIDAAGMLDPARDPRVREELLALVTSPPRAATAVFRALATWDRHRAADRVEIPVLHVAAVPPNCPTALMEAAIPQAVTGQTVGAGHFNAYEVPDQVNAMIDQFLRHYTD